jgi:hypothetical protein
VLARGKTDIARAWVYVRDDRPFDGPAPPAAVFTIRVIEAANIRKPIWQDMRVFCKRMRMVATGSFMRLAEVRV